MILDNEFTVAAPVDQVWAYFLDVPNLAPCLPGATLVGDDGDGTYQGKVVAALGPVKLNFSGTAQIVEADEAAHRMVLRGGGLGGPGPRRGRDDDHRDDGADGRRHAGERRQDLSISGAAANYGRGLIADVTSVLLGSFAECVQANIAGGGGHGDGRAGRARPAASPSACGPR